VFAAEALLFLASAWLARRIHVPAGTSDIPAVPVLSRQPAKESP
jgi:hypothetical protein